MPRAHVTRRKRLESFKSADQSFGTFFVGAMSEGEKLATKGTPDTEGFHELTTLVNDVLKQFQESIIKMIDKVNNKNILFVPWGHCFHCLFEKK
ncbi:hypothetical protein FBUS_09003 [Fasciolopsis buskii]|uniref:Uncharacterized protein n=1 Tax=Fasciolopsis buskii TaxID=27845 RepID=A0A8E0RXH1_9TREM|nr:hypothetical protein FBUS_09003 [Fasciolopsis buski]